MNVVVYFTAELFHADFALEGFEFEVRFDMVAKPTLLGKRLGTELALEAMNLGMRFLMVIQATFAYELPQAYVTGERPFSRVNTNMIPKCFLHAEAFVTKLTDVRTLSRMNANVHT